MVGVTGLSRLLSVREAVKVASFQRWASDTANSPPAWVRVIRMGGAHAGSGHAVCGVGGGWVALSVCPCSCALQSPSHRGGSGSVQVAGGVQFGDR